MAWPHSLPLNHAVATPSIAVFIKVSLLEIQHKEEVLQGT